MIRYLIITCSLLFSFHGKSQCVNYNYDVKVFNWSPSKGAPARYVKNVVDTVEAGSYLIFLGQDNEGVWTVYGQNDDDSTTAILEYAKFSGEKESFPVIQVGLMDMENFDYQQNGDELMQQIWATADQKEVDFNSLKPLYYGKWLSNDQCKIKVADKGKHQALVWQLKYESMMCWCFTEWSTYTEEIATLD